MTTLTLNTTINHEPRIRDLDLAEKLGMTDPHSIRRIIEANRAELEMHGVVSDRRSETSEKGGRPSIEYFLNEAQAILVCMFSRTQKAAEVRKAVIGVFNAWRRGELPALGNAADTAPVVKPRLRRRAIQALPPPERAWTLKETLDLAENIDVWISTPGARDNMLLIVRAFEKVLSDLKAITHTAHTLHEFYDDGSWIVARDTQIRRAA